MKIKNWEEKIKWKNLIHKANKYKYHFQQYQTIRSFGESIYSGKININEAETDQRNSLRNMVEFNDRSRPKTAEGKVKKALMKVHMPFMKVNPLCRVNS